MISVTSLQKLRRAYDIAVNNDLTNLAELVSGECSLEDAIDTSKRRRRDIYSVRCYGMDIGIRSGVAEDISVGAWIRRRRRFALRCTIQIRS